MAATPAEQSASPAKWAFLPLSTIFITLLVGHKCIVDGLSRFTRVSGVPYSASTAAVLGECVKVPVISVVILFFEGRRGFGKVIRDALTDRPLRLALPGLAYSVQNILYFQALSHLSVATYQILSQSKLLFTAIFMVTLLGKRLGRQQVLSLVLLMAGTVLTQLSEIPRNAAAGGGHALQGGLYTFAGALLSAFPNVYYEKVLKTKGQNQWSSNIQLTFWIWFWLVIISLPSLVNSGMGEGVAVGSGMMAGITGWVWLVIVLQSFKCVLIPAALKYSDNIIYSYAKPLSILLTAVIAAVVSGILPSKEFLCGAGLVFVSMFLYGS